MESTDLNFSLPIIREFFRQNKVEITDILLFGSRARGDFESNSDYDILIITKEDLSYSEKRDFLIRLTQLLISRNAMLPMDLIIKSQNAYTAEKSQIGTLAFNIASESVLI